MKKRLIVSVVTCMILLTVVVGAASINGDFNGFPIVNVQVNGKSVSSEVPGVNLHGKTVLPIKAVAETFNAIVEWNAETWTVNLVRPEVDLIFASNIEEDEDGVLNIQNPYKYQSVGSNNSFYTYVSMSDMKPGNYEFRVAIADEDGNIIYTTSPSTYEAVEKDDSFYITNYFENVRFDKVGDYKFHFQIRYGNEFKTVHIKEMYVR
ncbi:MAG: hypothetical protein K0R93_1068 [Anaerosolibacter sp.]|uniref:stalk domain-containing protein n=1 Tax=Anaerosolibacter sp. TaxID=1872527 RepID=UPI0026321030|nr:stalk domain-containing protein [Anaerosolibacter sp.]MDF2546170.1 hypothetical protein [Anaerosolibacter sp.]